MKKNLSAMFLSLLLSLIATAAFAQQEEETVTPPPVPKWVSEKGYWVIESSKAKPSNNTLFFYNHDHVLVYKEKVDGFVFNINKRSIKMRLKKVLDQSVLAYEQKRTASENEMWVMNLLRQ